MISPTYMVVVIILATACGAASLWESVDIFTARNAPIVSGRIISREPIRQYSVPRVDFTILIEGTETKVHARAQRYLMDKVPDTVRFHYAGDPARDVFLHEHEEHPYWIALFCLSVAIILTFSMKSQRLRELLGWPTVGTPATQPQGRAAR